MHLAQRALGCSSSTLFTTPLVSISRSVGSLRARVPLLVVFSGSCVRALGSHGNSHDCMHNVSHDDTRWNLELVHAG
jgi:hypothetical protein